MKYLSEAVGEGCIVARVVASSYNDNGDVITTFELEYPRFIHGELMTHRCLVGSTELYFDLPSGSQNSEYSLYKMSISEFYDKWTNGAKKRKPSRYVEKDLSNIDSDVCYTAKELARLVGYASPSNIRGACRSGELRDMNPCKRRGEDFIVKGSVFKEWASTPNSYQQDISCRLKAMRIRALDEKTGEVIHTNITDIWKVGEKETYTLTAGSYSITGTSDHPILTDKGWKDMGEITESDSVVVVNNMKKDKVDPLTHQKVNGVWRSRWQAQIREKLAAEQEGVCLDCGESSELEVHHIEPVYLRPDLCFDEENVVAICEGCHKERHKVQGWQEGNPLSPNFVKVTGLVKTGEVEEVFDLSVEDENHNFVANGIVVHNCFSRNAMSSRAIPIEKMIEQVKENPATPIHWGLNQSGMQAKKQDPDWDAFGRGEYQWYAAVHRAAEVATVMSEQGYHKQIVNRLLEPFQVMKTILTATELDNFFYLRCHKDAQPEIKELAECMEAAAYSAPKEKLKSGEWHTPYVDHFRASDGDATLEYHSNNSAVSIEDALKISASCCAQVSFRSCDDSLDKALRVYDRLVESKPVHASPFEHQASPMGCVHHPYWPDGSLEYGIEDGITHVDHTGYAWSGNFKGWVQHRQLIKGNVYNSVV